MDIKELVFKNREEMTQELQRSANIYEGYIPGRIGFNFPNANGSYTIAYIKGDIHTKKHELLHAKYYINAEYRKYVRDLWNSLDPED